MTIESDKKYIPRLIALETTRICNLNCKHCRADAGKRTFDNELTRDEIFRILKNISTFALPIIILTGGEPMSRSDIYEIASYGTGLGLTMVMAPCGSLVTPESVENIKNAGIKGISLSLDAANREAHDEFRGQKGSFDMAVNAAKIAKTHGLEFQINSTIHKNNAKDIPEILKLAISLGAKAFHPFLLVPTGRAKNLAGEALSSKEYEEVLVWLCEQSKITSSIPIKPTCAPHYARIKMQRGQIQTGENHVGKHGAGSGMSCMGGQSFAFISHIGKVQTCGFLDIEGGDLRKEQYDFKKIWNRSPLFLNIRDPRKYKGKCGKCEFLRVCGGCRARAFAESGDYLEAEPCCAYTSHKNNAND